MNTLVLDVETEIFSNGNPFDARNKLVCVSWKVNEIEAQAEQWPCDHIQHKVAACDLLVGFNFKFDYHWLHNSGVDLSGKRIWDCQAAHYILSGQAHIFPSLNEVLAHYGLPQKLDVVKTEYWDKGITTSLVHWDILREYAIGDVDGTYEVFRRQWEECTPEQRTLVLLDGQDMHVLREMEYNGLLYDYELCQQREEELNKQIEQIEQELKAIYPTVPINFSSNDDLSAFLYGGVIEQVVKVHDGFYKSGIKKGQPRLKNEVVSHNLPALYKPLRGSELKKAGYYATNEPTLRQLKGPKKIVGLLLELAKLRKLNSTYYNGLPKINREMNWPMGILHSNFNLTQTKTSRLSSNKPNQQNMAGDIQDVFVSRYSS